MLLENDRRFMPFYRFFSIYAKIYFLNSEIFNICELTDFVYLVDFNYYCCLIPGMEKRSSYSG